MAEAVVGLLIGKLGAALANEAAKLGASLLCKEASALEVLLGEIREAKEELESMQAYLQKAERFKDTDKTTGIFVRKIRGLAFEIENVVDAFTYRLEEDKHGGFAAKMTKRIKHIKIWRRLARNLREIKQRLKDADERKYRYDTKGVGEDAEDSSGGDCSKFVDQALYFADEDDLVGIEEDKKVLVQWLTCGFGQQSIVATVWGMGGVGKTTLVSHVYNTVKVGFDAAVWITVSKSYQVEAMLKMIAKQLSIRVDVDGMAKRALTEVIYTYLQGKKYILVLDDVWGVDVWFNIRDAFPTTGGVSSRFVITSRIHEVALLATENCVIRLQPLEEGHSLQLFCKEAFWKDQNKTCPGELEALAHKFVGRCSGLPIAIACIGRLLSCKPPNYSDWQNVYSELERQLTSNAVLDVSVILKVSLEDLPYDLKNCFLHCALFPEDYSIYMRRVMRHWIAAGFIREKENRSLEEVAEGYLAELVNRSLLQVVERNDSGRLKCCRMHDVIRLLALDKAREESFGEVYDGSREFFAEDTRRLWLQSENLEQMSRRGTTHLRALHVFASFVNVDLLRPILASSNLVSTLDLQGVRIKLLPGEVFNLFNLRYLGLRDTVIESLPEAIGRLRNLQVLDAGNSQLSNLPNNIVKLEKLRYLYASTGSGEDRCIGARVPNGIHLLKALQALRSVKASSEIVRAVGYLTELRTFAISGVKGEQSADLSNAIAKMNHLVDLEIASTGEEEVLQLERLCLPQTISALRLQGPLEKASMPQALSSWSRLGSLTWLQLDFSRIDQESFSYLLMLRGLCHLALIKAYEGEKLHFSARSFPQLRSLSILGAPQLHQVEIEEGAMPSLALLMFRDCPELKSIPPDIEHLRDLKQVSLQRTSEEPMHREASAKESKQSR
jgi:disease resistance protein RPM1